MEVFEQRGFEQTKCEAHCIPQPQMAKDESIVAYKVYDSCRRQDCLTARELGPSLEYECCGHVVWAPIGAKSVSMDRLKISKIHVMRKKPCAFRNGFWDISIEYTFNYELTFHGLGACIIDVVKAYNTFNSKITLFGSLDNNLTIGTDLFSCNAESDTFESAPFAWVEAKAVGLGAKLHRHHVKGYEDCQAVYCTIGLFSTSKLFRMVHLNVASTGFSMLEDCTHVCDIHPCEYFVDLDFPMDSFFSPQRKKFMAGQHENPPYIL